MQPRSTHKERDVGMAFGARDRQLKRDGRIIVRELHFLSESLGKRGRNVLNHGARTDFVSVQDVSGGRITHGYAQLVVRHQNAG